MTKTTLKTIVVEMWQHFEKRVSNYGIGPDDMEKVIQFAPNMILRIGEGAIGYWNSLAKGGWATIGPRMLGPKFERGTLTKVGKRTFLGPAPMGSKVAIIIEKLDGKAGAGVVISVYNRKGIVIQRERMTFPKGNSTPKKRFVVGDGKCGIVSVEMDAIMPALRVDKFEFRIRYEERPEMDDQRPVKGFSDLHVHQMAEYGFFGNWLHGSHTGPANKALAPCNSSSHAIPQSIWNLINNDASAPKVYHGRGYPGFEDWPHHLEMGHQQVHESWLADAHKRGLSLIVSCAVNNEPFSIIMGLLHPHEAKGPFRDMPAVKNQIQRIHGFAKGHTWYRVALNPWHAREIIHSGKMAVVISVECSNLFPLDEGDFVDQLDELYRMGVRCLQIAHEVDSRFAGAAPQEKMFSHLQTIKRNTSLQRLAKLDIGLGFNLDEKGKNTVGLTKQGERLVNAIMDRHMLIDTAHLSERALAGVYSIAARRHKYPLINTHTKFYDVLSQDEREVQREFLTRSYQIPMYIDTGGIVGLRTGPWVNPESTPVAVVTDQGDVGSARSFAQQVTYASRKKLPVAIGSDINGFINQLGPRNDGTAKPPSVSAEYWKEGFRHIGLLPDLIEDLRALRTPGAETLANSTELFLKSWERTWIRRSEK